MKIREIKDLLSAELLCGEGHLENDVHSACCSDMMSDVLAYVKDQAVLLTGLVNAQVIREEILRLKEEGATIILSTHNMESVEELCDNIALINKSHVVISGGVDEIRRKYGNNNVELVYTGNVLESVGNVFNVLSDQDDAGRHTAVLELLDGNGSNAALNAILAQGVTVNSFKELVPRMNDIFIKLVTEEE